MSYSTGLVVCLSIACVAVGILIGMLIMVCYRRIQCFVPTDNNDTTHYHQQQHPDNDRRVSAITLNGIHSIHSGNPNVHHFAPQYFTSATGSIGDRNDIGDIVTFTDRRPEILTERPRSHSQSQTLPIQEPIHYNRMPNKSAPSGFRTSHPGRFNNVNRKTRQFSTSSNNGRDGEESLSGSKGSTDRLGLGSSQDHEPQTPQINHNSSNNNNIVEETNECLPMQVFHHQSFGNTDHNNIKDSGRKFIPTGHGTGNGDPSRRVSLPVTNPKSKLGIGGPSNSEDNDTVIDIDTTLLKMLELCPDDIRNAIYEPCETSRTIFLREKKIVYMCKMLDEDGGLLELANMGVSLYVPPGAIPFKQRNLITLVLNWDLNDNPPMEKKEALVSPVVYCGPHGSVFEKPCLLKFKHCAHDTRFARILTSQTDLFDSKTWREYDDCAESEGDDDDDVDNDDQDEIPCPQEGVNLTVDECQVEVPHFSLFTCVMGSKQRLLKKWIQVAVFTHNVGPSLKHQEIRIYFLNKTPCALQWAIQNEAKYDFNLACPDTTFLFMESGENMTVHLSYVSEGWEMIIGEDGDPMRMVFFEQIWHGACPHTCMCFRKVVRKNSFVSGDLSNISGAYEIKDRKDSMVEITPIAASECSEINIALRLNQERCENLSVPLNVLAHNIKLKISETQVKFADHDVRISDTKVKMIDEGGAFGPTS